MNKAMLEIIQNRVIDRSRPIKGASRGNARVYNCYANEYVARYSILSHDNKTAMILLYPKDEYEVFCITIAYWNSKKKEWRFADDTGFYNFEEKNEVKNGRGLLHITLGFDVITTPM